MASRARLLSGPRRGSRFSVETSMGEARWRQCGPARSPFRPHLRPRSTGLPVAVLLAIVAASCHDSTAPREVGTIELSMPQATLDAIGALDTVSAVVRDVNGRIIAHADVAWSGTSGVAIRKLNSPSAVELKALASGTGEVTVRSGNVQATLPVEVVQKAAVLIPPGNPVAAPVATRIPEQIQVLVRDRLGAPAAGVSVAFEASAGSLASSTVVTEADGIARADWTLGTAAGEQVLTARAGNARVLIRATATPGPVAALEKVAGDGQRGWLGSPTDVRPVVKATDSYGNPVHGVSIVFTPSQGTVTGGMQLTLTDGTATLGAWTLGTTPGAMTLTASAPAYGTTATFSATAAAGQPLVRIIVESGSDQIGIESMPVPAPPRVKLVDTTGVAQANRQVQFEVVSGAGTVSAATATTSADGTATVAWTLGAAGGANTLRVRVADGPATNNDVVFTALACTGGNGAYVINVCFTTPVTASQRAVFMDAAARWSSIVTGDVPDVELDIASIPGCSVPKLNARLDDLVIFARIEPIDGPGQILGSAGWCVTRDDGKPVIGQMRFDIADVTMMEASGRFRDVILHEMGHVIGLGTIWTSTNYLINPGIPGGPRLDTHFSGPKAVEGFNMIGGAVYTGGAKVPVENAAGPGSINSHWRESVLGNELMTPFINNGPNPLTVLSVMSLADLGYEVNPAAADSHEQSDVLADRRAAPLIFLENDVYTGPRYTVDRAGRVRPVR